MARRQDRLLLRLFYASLIILAAMHPDTTTQLAETATALLLGIVDGAAKAAADQPGPALLAAGAIWITHQIRTHRPRTARARAHA
ncbi:hypothetical protein [Streptomyces sp. NPDC052015]|uniref:hypothetical protein n=1 Tax=Streptomyces sp. NPDC052015 TaxID=3154755 RepID=UPI003418DD8F